MTLPQMRCGCSYCGGIIEGGGVRTADGELVHAGCLEEIRSNCTAYSFVREHMEILREILSDHHTDDELDGLWEVVRADYGEDIERWATR